jgi:hypothetical protein
MITGKIQKNSGLSTRALLVSVNISAWAGRKLDQRATDSANAAHNADASAGRYTKKLLPGAVELQRVGVIAGQARKYYYEQTLPWMSDGTRIVSSKNYLKFQEGMRKIRADFETAVKEFEEAYPRLRLEAQSKLGNLFDASEYPATISERFGIEVNFYPMPDSKDFRVDISDAEKREFERKLKQTESRAIQDAAKRLLDVVKLASERLKDPKAIFRDSLLENIGEIAALIPMLNISDDPQLDAISDSAKTLIDSVSADTVRKDGREREHVRSKLAEIESKMGAFMGVSK